MLSFESSLSNVVDDGNDDDDEVQRLITSLQDKQCSLDRLPAGDQKQVSKEVSGLLTAIHNKLQSERRVPEHFKSQLL